MRASRKIVLEAKNYNAKTPITYNKLDGGVDRDTLILFSHCQQALGPIPWAEIKKGKGTIVCILYKNEADWDMIEDLRWTCIYSNKGEQK